MQIVILVYRNEQSGNTPDTLEVLYANLRGKKKKKKSKNNNKSIEENENLFNTIKTRIYSVHDPSTV